MGLNSIQKSELKSILAVQVKIFNNNVHHITKHAPVFPLTDLLYLANLLWNAEKPYYPGSLELRRMAALKNAICCNTGARWVDVSRIRWSSMFVTERSYGIFVKFTMPFSKQDVAKNDSRVITFSSLRNTNCCAVRLLLDY